MAEPNQDKPELTLDSSAENGSSPVNGALPANDVPGVGPARKKKPEQGSATNNINSEEAENFCREIMANGWFDDREQINDERLEALMNYVSLASYNNADQGFSLQVIDSETNAPNGRAIGWYYYPRSAGGGDQEYICGKKRGFCDADADAIIALSAVHGWMSVDLHGTQAQKDMLWFAAMKQGIAVSGFDGFKPSDEARERWTEYKRNNPDPAVTPTGNAPPRGDDNPGVTSNGGTPAAQTPQKDSATPQDSQPQHGGADQAPSTFAEQLEDYKKQIKGADVKRLGVQYKRFLAEAEDAELNNDKEGAANWRLAAKAMDDEIKRQEKEAAEAKAKKDAAATPADQPAAPPAKEAPPAKKVQDKETQEGQQALWSEQELLRGKYAKAAARPAASANKNKTENKSATGKKKLAPEYNAAAPRPKTRSEQAATQPRDSGGRFMSPKDAAAPKKTSGAQGKSKPGTKSHNPKPNSGYGAAAAH